MISADVYVCVLSKMNEDAFCRMPIQDNNLYDNICNFERRLVVAYDASVCMYDSFATDRNVITTVKMQMTDFSFLLVDLI
jgi:hypothetical protein